MHNIIKFNPKGGGSNASRVSTYIWIFNFITSSRLYNQKAKIVNKIYIQKTKERREQRMGLVVTALIGVIILIVIGVKSALAKNYPDGEEIPLRVRLIMIIIAIPMVVIPILAFFRIL